MHTRQIFVLAFCALAACGIPAAGDGARTCGCSGDPPTFPQSREPDWSATNGLIAFSSDRSGNSNIYVMRPDGTHLRRVSHSKLWDSAVDWGGRP
jgi:hypothetical protein